MLKFYVVVTHFEWKQMLAEIGRAQGGMNVSEYNAQEQAI